MFAFIVLLIVILWFCIEPVSLFSVSWVAGFLFCCMMGTSNTYCIGAYFISTITMWATMQILYPEGSEEYSSHHLFIFCVIVGIITIMTVSLLSATLQHNKMLFIYIPSICLSLPATCFIIKLCSKDKGNDAQKLPSANDLMRPLNDTSMYLLWLIQQWHLDGLSAESASYVKLQKFDEYVYTSNSLVTEFSSIPSRIKCMLFAMVYLIGQDKIRELLADVLTDINNKEYDNAAYKVLNSKFGELYPLEATEISDIMLHGDVIVCLLYTSPSPRD